MTSIGNYWVLHKTTNMNLPFSDTWYDVIFAESLDFFLNVSPNSANSVTNILVITVKGLGHLLCLRSRCYHSVTKTHV